MTLCFIIGCEFLLRDHSLATSERNWPVHGSLANWRSKRDFTAKSLRLLSCLAHDYICDAEAVCVGT
jgi:hypothetical protein